MRRRRPLLKGTWTTSTTFIVERIICRHRIRATQPPRQLGHRIVGIKIRETVDVAWLIPSGGVDAHGTSSRTPSRYQQEVPSPKVPRRLPPTPGGSSTTSSPTTSYGMPEPEPYHESGTSQRPGHHSGDSYASSTGSHDLLRKATAGSASGRRLPTAPAHMNGSRPGLPSDPRPSIRVAHTSYESHSSSSSTGNYATSISREPSYRPPGALPPTAPGRHDTFSSLSSTASTAFDAYDPDSRSNYSNGYYAPDKYQYQLPTPDSSSSLGIPPPPLPRKPSREYMSSPADEGSQCSYHTQASR